jgi:hypothetical protein
MQLRDQNAVAKLVDLQRDLVRGFLGIGAAGLQVRSRGVVRRLDLGKERRERLDQACSARNECATSLTEDYRLRGNWCAVDAAQAARSIRISTASPTFTFLSCVSR